MMEWKEGRDKSTIIVGNIKKLHPQLTQHCGFRSWNSFKLFPLFLKITYREDADTLAWFPHFCPESVGMVKSYLDFKAKGCYGCP